MTKIEWTDITWNPVWGCKNKCDYCYARGIANRFAEIMIRREDSYKNFDPVAAELFFDEKVEKIKNFQPYYFEHAMLFKKFPQKPKRIFIGSMSDIAFWKREWLITLAEEIKKYPQHSFQLLTKKPEIYRYLETIMPLNVWFGVTVTKNDELDKIDKMIIGRNPKRLIFISFEPLLEDLTDKLQYSAVNLFDWIIIGTMTGQKRRPAKISWIRFIIELARIYDIPVFVKKIEKNGEIIETIHNFPRRIRIRQFPNAKRIIINKWKIDNG